MDLSWEDIWVSRRPQTRLCFICGDVATETWHASVSCVVSEDWNKASVPKVPMEKMSLIDKPFKRVVIDLVGPISLLSEARH